MQRAQPDTLDTTEGADNRLFFLATPEDIALRKLEWYKMGGGVSDRQWLDILGVIKFQDYKLDRAYLQHWAEQLGLTNLLERALEDAGL